MTDRTFQGQRDAGWGLYFFQARMFDSALGRFAQADSIVPGAGNPLAWDRYAGLGNNPVRYTDPSGHRPACEDTDDPACAEVIYTLDEIAGQYGITFDGSWTKKEKAVILTGAYFIGKATNRVLTKHLSYASAFRKAHGSKTQFYKSTSAGSTCGAGADTVTCFTGAELSPQLVAHELGHVFSWEYGGDPYEDLGNAALMDNEDNWITGTHPEGDFERTTSGYKGEGPPYMYHGPIEWDDWNSNTNNTARNEDYADMYMNWVFDTVDYSGTSLGAGKVRYDWMTTNVAEYVRR